MAPVCHATVTYMITIMRRIIPQNLSLLGRDRAFFPELAANRQGLTASLRAWDLSDFSMHTPGSAQSLRVR